MSVKAMMVGNTLVCHLNGKMYNKVIESDAEKLSVMEQALNIDENDPEEVKALIEIFERKKTAEEVKEEKALAKEIKKVEGTKTLLSWMEDIKENGDEHFEVQGIKLFMKGINITVPEFLAIEFCSRRDNEGDLTSLMNFWKLCALNKDPRCREDLYKFLVNHDMVVTPSGYFVSYRNVQIQVDKESGKKKEGAKALNYFVADAYTKTKIQKKGAHRFDIFQLKPEITGKAQFVRQGTGWFDKRTADKDYELVGNLEDLYEGLSDVEEETTTVYTDNHSRTMTIVIGERVFMDRDKCNADPNQTCSSGLHLGSPSFMYKGMFGQEGLICLCNPMHVVAVPYRDGEKLRCCEYLPVGVAEYDENGRIIPLETATFEFEYAEHTQAEINKMLNNSRFESLVEHEIVPREISKDSLRVISSGLQKSLDDMTEAVKSRVDKAM